MADNIDLQFNLLAQEFGKAEKSAQVEKYGPVPGALSMFNPFNIFRYSKYGLNPNQYRSKLHFDAGSGDLSGNDAAALMGVNVDPFVPNSNQIEVLQKGGAADREALGDLATGTNQTSSQILSQLQPFTDQRKVIENPDAASIIRWAQLEATRGARTAKGAAPYAVSDFIYCTYYGKVPNNRMVTLRRYPIPIEDNLAISARKAPLVPLAQAVTWYGEDVGNKINDVLNLSWGLKWTPRTASVQDIQGNELTVEDLVAALPGEIDPAVVQVLKTQIFSGSEGKVDILKLSGYDVAAQEYIKAAYQENGPYWNRILGPVNVIDSTLIRDRGFAAQDNPIKLQFKYSLRAYNGLNPKLVFLDLYTNFLSLTYNTAPFWGGGARYFQQTGVTIPQLQMEQKILDGDMLGAIQVGTEELAQLASTRLQELIALAKSATSAVESAAGGSILGADGTIKAEYEQQLAEAVSPGKRRIDDRTSAAQRGTSDDGSLNPVERALAPRLGKLLRKPLLYRAILDGRAVGEWHVTVGNPMNPMAMIGNLCLDKVTCTFNEALGLDDFPTEVTFNVTLKHGRPRAKQDLESIFNLGNGAMSFNELPDPSSAGNSYGDNTTARMNSARDGTNLDPAQTGTEGQPFDITNANAENGVAAGGTTNQGKINADAVINRRTDDVRTTQEIQNLTKAYSEKVSRLYGQNYGDSPILTDYFTELKTKD